MLTDQPSINSEQRLLICKSCDSFTQKNVCSECNCYMPVKVLLPFMNCPKNKWIITTPQKGSCQTKINKV